MEKRQVAKRARKMRPVKKCFVKMRHPMQSYTSHEVKMIGPISASLEMWNLPANVAIMQGPPIVYDTHSFH